MIFDYVVENIIDYVVEKRKGYHSISKEIPIVFHNGSTYDYHFIIKELVKEFEGNFECLGENTGKIHNIFSTNKEKD